MKRRLFIKQTGIATAGLFAAPYLFEKCAPNGGGDPVSTVSLTSPTAVPDFQKYANMFDQATAELRLFGAGPIVPGEAEAFTLGLDDVAEQLIYGAEAPAELNAEFAEFGQEMVGATSELSEVSSEFPYIKQGSPEYLGLAENYSLLKVSRGAAIMHAATLATFPHPEREPTARKMYAEAEIMYKSLSAEFPDTKKSPETNNAELASGAEQLMGNAELYVGGSNMLSGTQEFYFASAEIGLSVADSRNIKGFSKQFTALHQGAAAQLLGRPRISKEMLQLAQSEFAQGFENAESFRLTKGADFLLAAASSVELSAEQHDIGFGIFNHGEAITGGAENVLAEAWVKPGKLLLKSSEVYLELAKGEAAELGAERMIGGAAELITAAEKNAEQLVTGGETYLWGAEQYIGGTLNFRGSLLFTGGALQYRAGAELFSKGLAAGETIFTLGAEKNFQGAEDFELGAEALTLLQVAEGAADVLPAAENVYLGAEQLFGIAKPGNAKTGALEMVEGSELMIVGAENASESGAEMWNGALEMLTGSAELHNGVAEFSAAE